MTGAALRMTWHHFCVAGAALYTDGVDPRPSEVSQNCFVFDVVNFENEEVSQNCFVFDVVNFEN